MKAVTVRELKTELKERSNQELMELCLNLAKFKKENKELLTYLLFEADDESSYINSIKMEIEDQFDEVNNSSFYYMKKSIRKILRETKKYIRYSKKTQTEIELRLFFCEKLKSFQPSIKRSTVLKGVYFRELEAVRKKVGSLHEDLQYDYEMQLEELYAF
ncbi:MAG: hypothetical protein AAFN93_00930 [Bacteroidota bacterium]